MGFVVLTKARSRRRMRSGCWLQQQKPIFLRLGGLKLWCEFLIIFCPILLCFRGENQSITYDRRYLAKCACRGDNMDEMCEELRKGCFFGWYINTRTHTPHLLAVGTQMVLKANCEFHLGAKLWKCENIKALSWIVCSATEIDVLSRLIQALLSIFSAKWTTLSRVRYRTSFRP